MSERVRWEGSRGKGTVMAWFQDGAIVKWDEIGQDAPAYTLVPLDELVPIGFEVGEPFPVHPSKPEAWQ